MRPSPSLRLQPPPTPPSGENTGTGVAAALSASPPVGTSVGAIKSTDLSAKSRFLHTQRLLRASASTELPEILPEMPPEIPPHQPTAAEFEKKLLSQTGGDKGIVVYLSTHYSGTTGTEHSDVPGLSESTISVYCAEIHRVVSKLSEEVVHNMQPDSIREDAYGDAFFEIYTALLLSRLSTAGAARYALSIDSVKPVAIAYTSLAFGRDQLVSQDTADPTLIAIDRACAHTQSTWKKLMWRLNRFGQNLPLFGYLKQALAGASLAHSTLDTYLLDLIKIASAYQTAAIGADSHETAPLGSAIERLVKDVSPQGRFDPTLVRTVFSKQLMERFSNRPTIPKFFTTAMEWQIQARRNTAKRRKIDPPAQGAKGSTRLWDQKPQVQSAAATRQGNSPTPSALQQASAPASTVTTRTEVQTQESQHSSHRPQVEDEARGCSASKERHFEMVFDTTDPRLSLPDTKWSDLVLHTEPDIDSASLPKLNEFDDFPKLD
jgi:hypothetical protein